jgi:hypothetical protein
MATREYLRRNGSRLLTVTGSGGVGKTLVALQAGKHDAVAVSRPGLNGISVSAVNASGSASTGVEAGDLASPDLGVGRWRFLPEGI